MMKLAILLVSLTKGFSFIIGKHTYNVKDLRSQTEWPGIRKHTAASFWPSEQNPPFQPAFPSVVLKMANANEDGVKGENIGSTNLEYQDGNTDELSDATLKEMEEGRPSEWMVMKDLLGINLFTYVLAAAIIFFLVMNVALGPGWLGSSLGIQGTGDFTETSTSLPDTIDLGSKDYLL